MPKTSTAVAPAYTSGSNRDPMNIARLRLQLQDPFLGAGSLYLDLEDRDLAWWQANVPWNQPTACTDGRTVKYYRPFVEQIVKDNGQTGVDFLLAHETLHCLSLSHARMDNRDPLLWNQACVTGDTNVLMANGTNVPIISLVPGDHVASPYGPSKVLAIIPKGVKDTVELDVQTSYPLRCTIDHRIFTERGFKSAEEWKDNTVYGWVLGEARSQDVRFEQLPNNEHKETITRNQSLLWSYLRDASSAGFKRSPRTSMESLEQFGTVRKSNRTTTSLFCGDSGWRGYGNFTSPRGQGASQVLRAPRNTSYQHLLQTSPISRGTRISQLSCVQQSGSKILEFQGNGVQRRSSPQTSFALVDSQTRSNSVGSSLHRHAETADQHQDSSNARNVRDLAQSQGAKRTRLQVREGVRRAPVYDIITEHHCFYANGVLVHNCDYQVHQVLEEGGWKVPKSLGGIPPLHDARFKNMSIEQIYAILKQEQDDHDSSGGKKGKDHKQGAGGFGLVVTPCDKDGRPLDSGALQAEAQNWQAKAQQAADMAKSCGSLKGCWERMVGEVLEPKIPWEEVLRRFVRDARNRRGEDFTWTPTNRRAIHRGLHFPSIEKIGMGVLDIHVDLSGSIGQAEMDLFAGEIRGIRHDAKPELTRIIYFDTEVCRVDELALDQELDITGVKAGGGTDFRPSFNWVEKTGLAPACAVVLTDLCCSSYVDQPPYEVLWVSTVVGSKAPWGQTIELGV